MRLFTKDAIYKFVLLLNIYMFCSSLIDLVL
jgi:hypothetical protein